jgi:ArsR family transcriptional regulator
MIAETLKILSDPTRLRILNLLSHGELCVCELEYVLGIKQANLSKHLGILNRNHLISGQRRNKFVYYSLEDTFFETYPFARDILALLKTESVYLEDDKAFASYQCSDINCDCLSVVLLEERLKELKANAAI